MYQIIPLLLAVALLMPWTGPADPGNRIAAANAADGLAAQALIYHQAAVAYLRANPGAVGAVTPSSLPSGWSASGMAACAGSGMVATSVAVPTTLSKPAVAAAMGRLWGGYPIVGQSAANALIDPYTGAALTLPCAVPDRTPVILSQVGD